MANPSDYQEPATEKFELNFTGVTRADVQGDVSISVTYPKGKAMLAIVALAEAGTAKYGAQLAAALSGDHSVAEALAAAGLAVADGDDE
jgi:hypothetical protein